MSRLSPILLLAAVTLCAAAPAASAVPVKKLDGNLGALWTTVQLLLAVSSPNPRKSDTRPARRR
jgi:hypothetical protein